MGGPIQSVTRSRNRARIPRRNASAGRRENSTLLLHVRSPFLFDEDYRRRSQICGGAKNFGKTSAAKWSRTKGPRIHREGQQPLREGLILRGFARDHKINPASQLTILAQKCKYTTMA